MGFARGRSENCSIPRRACGLWKGFNCFLEFVLSEEETRLAILEGGVRFSKQNIARPWQTTGSCEAKSEGQGESQGQGEGLRSLRTPCLGAGTRTKTPQCRLSVLIFRLPLLSIPQKGCPQKMTPRIPTASPSTRKVLFAAFCHFVQLATGKTSMQWTGGMLPSGPGVQFDFSPSARSPSRPGARPRPSVHQESQHILEQENNRLNEEIHTRT